MTPNTDKIKNVRHIITAMDLGQIIKVSKDEVDLISEIYKGIAPGRRLNTACQSCIQMALSYIAAWSEQNPGTTNEETQTTEKKKKKNGI
jgi:hypothetical protein